MKMKNIGIAAKYAGIALAGCAVVVVAAESVSAERGSKGAPVLTASDSAPSVKSSVTDNLGAPAPSVSSTESTVSLSPQSSVSAESSVHYEPQIISTSSEPQIEPPAPVQSSEEAPQSSAAEPIAVQSENTPSTTWDIPDNYPSEFIPVVSGLVLSPATTSQPSSSSSSASSSSKPKPQSSSSSSSTTTVTSELPMPVSSASEAPPAQSVEPPVSSIEPPEPALPPAPEFVIVNINTATVEELTQLDGIGEDKALAIIEFRERFGGFTSIYEIREVDGIGSSTFEQIRDFIVI